MTVILKSYCYSQHELPFVIANLDEGSDYIDKLILYEYNYTHTGIKKDYEMEKVIHNIPEQLLKKLVYKKIDLSAIFTKQNNVPVKRKILSFLPSNYNTSIEDIVDFEKGHSVMEPIQRSWFYNDLDYSNIPDDTIIIDIDIDEIIYKDCYGKLISEFIKRNIPLGIGMYPFFFKNTYLWTDFICNASTIHTYGMVKNNTQIIHGVKIKNLRDVQDRTQEIYGCHMSWVMPVKYMTTKLLAYAHSENRKFADSEILENAIKEKKYIFEPDRPFNINVLELTDDKIPKTLQKDNLFIYLEE